MLFSIFVGFLVLIILIIASFVIVRSSQSEVNRSFAYFTVVTAAWITANYTGANFKNHPISAFFIHADLFTGTYLGLLLWNFTRHLVGQTNVSKTYLNLMGRVTGPLILITSGVAFGTFSSRIALITTHPVSIAYGSLFPVYAGWLCALLLFGITNLLLALYKSKGELKQQITAMVFGTAIAVVIVALTNLVLPLITTNKSINLLAGNLAYVGILIFIVMTFYAIVRHKLFDLRLLLARTVAYSSVLATFTAIYIAVAAILSTRLIDGYKATSKELLINTLLIFALVLTMNPVKRFFDRFTNRIFFRNSYDPQQLLDSINQILVSVFELNALMKKSSIIIASAMQPTFVTFGIKETPHTPRRIVGTTGHPLFKEQDIDIVSAITPAFRDSLIVTEALPLKYDKLKKILRSYDIAIVARLALIKNEEGIGYLMLGPKKNGSLYKAQDLRIIQLIGNELAIALQNALRFEEIANFNLTLQERINNATRQLRHSNEKLKQLDETKDDFISMASHQLRTPLTSIKGYLSMVLEGDAGKVSPVQKEMLSQAYFSSQRMVYIIADLLNVSRLKTGKFIIDAAPVNLAEVIQEELEQVQEMAAAKQLTLQYDKPKDFPELMFDDTKTRQIIMNFVDNAIYYTPAGGHITIRLIDKPSTIELRVEDNGMGVPKSEQPHMFTKFYRAGNARKARPDGTGLGLFMAKKVIVAQGGSVLFESQEGKGSMFGFVFSKDKALPTAGQPTPTPQTSKAA